jgi:hypothetical protein
MDFDEAGEAWRNGFTSGTEAKYGCPYRPGTVEAKAWQAGWDQGALKRNGSPYRNEPLDSEVGEPPSSDS